MADISPMKPGHSSRPENASGSGPESSLEGETRIGFRMAGIGMEVVSQVAAGALLGWIFDRWRGTAPTGLLIGSVIGIIVGMWSFIRGALKLNRELERQYPTAGRGRPLPPEEADNDKDPWDRTDTNDDQINPN